MKSKIYLFILVDNKEVEIIPNNFIKLSVINIKTQAFIKLLYKKNKGCKRRLV